MTKRGKELTGHKLRTRIANKARRAAKLPARLEARAKKAAAQAKVQETVVIAGQTVIVEG
jgi:hypothetical protein